jgi:phosphatidylglycerophosphatase A
MVPKSGTGGGVLPIRMTDKIIPAVIIEAIINTIIFRFFDILKSIKKIPQK